MLERGSARVASASTQPRILVCGLNPHAGEGGHLGREEIEVIAPVVAALRAQGLASTGPVPADTAFTPASLADTDAVLAMYHDQGLPVIKHAGFGHAVNVTLGLPFMRTSVDHGTALDLAGTGRADPGSLFAAIRLARAPGGGRRNPGMIRARKRFGQHFLHDPGVARAHRRGDRPAARRAPGRDRPGARGAHRAAARALQATRGHRDRPRPDPACCERALRGPDELIVHEADVLEVDFAALHGGGAPLRVCGNLPYNISTPLLFHLLESRDRHRRHALHAAEGSRRPHGRAARAARTTAA